MKNTSQSGKRKRPHILPPLSLPKNITFNPMEPLKPPSALLNINGRLGSPIPRWHNPQEEATSENPNDNRPGIRITPCTDSEGNTLSKNQYNSDLRNDPHYKNNADMGYVTQRRNSMKTLGLIGGVRQFEQGGPRLPTPMVKSGRPVEGKPKPVETNKGFMPKKYAPLKPITKKSEEF